MIRSTGRLRDADAGGWPSLPRLIVSMYLCSYICSRVAKIQEVVFGSDSGRADMNTREEVTLTLQ